ncbi:MAG: M28 family metallopeptidase [Thermoplasmatota archaeon]
MELKKLVIALIVLIILVTFLQFYFDGNRGNDSSPDYNDYEFISNLVNKTNASRIEDDIEYLQSHKTRYIGTEGNNETTIWLKNKFDSFDLNTYYQNFTYEGKDLSNVIAYHEGKYEEEKDETIILSAHFDSINNQGVNLSAPGADDDASGIAAGIESARILSDYDFNRTIMFCAWNAEEVGLIGSMYFTENLYKTDWDIKGVYNFDMIGYLSNGHDIEIHSNHHSESLLDAMTDMDKKLDLSVNITPVTKDPETRSDHYSFWVKGYKACILIEETFNPHYHTVKDTIDKISIPMIKSVTQLSIGTSAKLLGVVESSDIMLAKKIVRNDRTLIIWKLDCLNIKMIEISKINRYF